jgi:hypothetical protein
VSVTAVQDQAVGRRSYLVAKEQLTLGDIAPSWDRRLKQLPASKWSLKWLKCYFDIVSIENCIVGEAFGQSSAYWDECAECKAFSKQFPLHFRNRSYKELERGVQRFVEHWNEKHRDAERSRRGLRWFDSLVRFDDYIRTIQ